MTERRKRALSQIGVGVALLVAAGITYWFQGNRDETFVSTFAECAAAGYPVAESYPRQCRTHDGKTFREDIGNELDKDDLIRISSPRPNETVRSPLKVTGVARGNWFFEASFPIAVVDWDGKIIGEGYATADSDWMTAQFVPFSASVELDATQMQGGYSNRGTLILRKNNPSGLPENDDALEIPIVFTENPASTKGACVVTGCSGQVCASEESVTTCEFRAEYTCYKTARCEKQTTGKCGWTETSELQACLKDPPATE